MAIGGEMANFKPDFSKGSAEYQYDYAIVTYSDETSEEVKNLLDDNDCPKQICQELQIGYIASTIKKYGDKVIFISDTLSNKATKIFLTPLYDKYITSIVFKRYSDSVQISFHDMDDSTSFSRWSRLSSNYYRTISITSKPVDQKPYEVLVHELDLSYKMDSESGKLSNDHEIQSHFNQIRYTNLLSQGDISGNPAGIHDELDTGDSFNYEYPTFGNVAILSGFDKIFTGFKSRRTRSQSKVTKTLICTTIDFYSDWIYAFDEDLHVELVSKMPDKLFTFNNGVLVYNRQIPDPLTYQYMNRVLLFRYSNGLNNGYIEMHIGFDVYLTLTSVEGLGNINPIKLTKSGWYPTPWNEQLNRVPKRFLDCSGLALLGDNVLFDPENLQIYFRKIDSDVHTVYLTVSDNSALTLDGEFVESLPIKYQFIEPMEEYDKTIKLGLEHKTLYSENNTLTYRNKLSHVSYQSGFISELTAPGNINALVGLIGIDGSDIDKAVFGYPGCISEVTLRHPLLKACIVSKVNYTGSIRKFDCSRYMSYILIYTTKDYDRLITDFYGNYILEIKSTLFGRRDYTLEIGGYNYDLS